MKAEHTGFGTVAAWALLFSLSCAAVGGCRSAPSVVADYREVSVHAAVAVLEADQKTVVADLGIPQAVWARPFGLYEWVYCVDGAPSRRFVFDWKGQILGQGLGGDELLCVHAAWEPMKGDQT